MFGQTTTEKKTNPVSQFYEWKSDKENKTGKFKGRNKQMESEVENTPEEFILIEQYSCIKGWDEKSGSGIYSNEVLSTKNEELIVRAGKADKPLFEGLYNKEAIEAIGGVFHKGIVTLQGGDLVEYYLKGGALFQWNEDLGSINTNEYKVKLDKVEERKKGAVVYYVPRRVQGAKITDKEKTSAMGAVTLLEDYANKNG